MARGTWGGLTDPNIYSVRVQFRLENSLCQIGWHVRDIGVQQLSVEGVAGVVRPWVEQHFVKVLSTLDRIETVDVVRIDNGEGFTHNFPELLGTQVISLGLQQPNFMCCVVGMKGELRKRYGQGRMFWPVRAKNHVDNNQLNSVGRAALADVISEFESRFVGNALTTATRAVNKHGALPPKAATPSTPARPAIPASWYDVTTLRLNPLVSALRSRKVNVGS